jgi:hypothetical protein
MKRQLENLKWVPSWVSHLGCVKGCLDYLGIEVSNAWLFGGTGHAFVINIGSDACPSGPTAWKTNMLSVLGRNLGYEADCLFGTKYDEDLATLQGRAWDFTRSALDQGIPCFGWELEIPEFYVIYGYDDIGYYFSGTECDDGKGPKAWQELGDTGIGVVELYSVRPGEAADDSTVVREALSFAIEHAASPSKWIFPDYRAGTDGYNLWIQGLKAGKSIRMGMAYNAAVWASCRRNGVDFLQEASERIGGGLEPTFDRAIGHYQLVAGHLKAVTELYPFAESYSQSPIGVDDKSKAAVAELELARDAEAAGLVELASIVAKLT